MSLNARRTLATMGTELSAEFVIFEPDDTLVDYVRARNPKPFTPTLPDQDAVYKERRAIDLATIEPLVALPDAVVNNSVRHQRGRRPASIDQAFIGVLLPTARSTIWRWPRAWSKAARSRPARASSSRPAPQAIHRAAMTAGYVATLMEAGAIVTPATCGACVGGHMGVLGPDEVCITASTRNFKGRMGDPSARIYMASPATVAASALAGQIASAAEFFQGDVS